MTDSATLIGTADTEAIRELLTHAIAQGHIWPAFQPIVDARNGTIAGFEILARWNHPGVGEISPVDFIPCLEQHGLIDTLSDALISRACREAVSWSDKFSLAFNVSPVQLTSDKFPDHLVELVAPTGFPLNRVELEVTEGSLITDENQAYRILQRCNDLGVKIGIDDFGTGYSSLARLESFPFHKLKIDTRFVRNLDSEAGKRRIVGAVIGLGQSLGITIVAEGIETEAEASILRTLGCNLAQGWYYGKGVPADLAHTKLKQSGDADIYSLPSLDSSPFQQFNQLGSLYDQAPVGLCFVDLDFRHVHANERFAKVLGMTRADIEGKSIHELFEGDFLRTTEDILRGCALRDTPIIRRHVLDGREFYIYHTYVKDLGGEGIGYSIVALDMTEESRLTSSLQQERDYANAILDSLPGSFVHCVFDNDTDMRLIRWNRSHEPRTGYSAEELKDSDPWKYFVSEQKGYVVERMNQMLAEGHGSVEADYLFRNGQRVPFLFSCVPFSYNGQRGFVGVGTDISKRREMEQELRRKTVILKGIVHNALDGVIIFDHGGNRIFQNQRLDDIFNIPEKIATNQDLQKQLAFCISRTRRAAEFADRVSWFQNHPDESGSDAIELIDGTILRVSTAPLYDDDRTYYGRVWIFRDLRQEAPLLAADRPEPPRDSVSEV